ncbi:MAG: hypothetical protein V3V49_11905 [Candidatus Krumholzibacteria bacterium]
MDRYFPTSFVELIGGVTALAAVGLAVLSIRTRGRAHATKMFAILSVASLACFSHHWGTYMVALFIVATAVTELDFLQNLAAIIRGNKPYFEYKKELLSPEEAQRKIEANGHHGFADQKARARPRSRRERRSPRRMSQATFRAAVEQLAAKKLSEIFGGAVETHVRFSFNGFSVEIEGIIQGNGRASDKLFEFKYVRKRVPTSHLIDKVRQLEEAADRYAVITGRSCEFHLVAIMLDGTKFPAAAAADIQRAIDASQYGASLRVLTPADIGLDLVDAASLEETRA